MISIAEILRWRTRLHPDRIALCHGEQRLTYRELDRRTTLLANALIREGVKPGERIAVLDKGHDKVVETIFAIAKVGAVYTPVNWRLAPSEIQVVLEDSGASVLFIGDEYREAFGGIKSMLSQVRQVVAYSGGELDWVNYEAFVLGVSEIDPYKDSKSADTCWQVYTSGTTGTPKGVEISHQNLLSMCTGGGVSYGSDSVALSCLPLFHIGGAGSLLSSFYQGARIVITRQVNLPEIIELLDKERITHALFVPALLNKILQEPGVHDRDFRHLRTIIYGASPIPEEVLKEAIDTFGCAFVQAYGLTETTGSITMLMEWDHQIARGKLRSCGVPVFGHEIRVVDKHGKLCSAGEIGEITVRGPNVMKGYWNRPEETAKVLKDGWFYTGDAGFMDAEGYLYIHDRVKDMIVSGGENIYSVEVENVLYAQPDIIEAAVIGIPSEQWGEMVHAIVVRATGSQIDDKAVLEFCRKRIASYKVPRSIEFVDELPRTPSGKILKTQLRERYWVGRDRQVN